jgi:hypothetical protein
MFVLPLVGWELSAARYPIVLYGSLHLPAIPLHDVMPCRAAEGHTILAYLFMMFIAHSGDLASHTDRERRTFQADGTLEPSATGLHPPTSGVSAESIGGEARAMDDAVLTHRLHFGFTITYHISFRR